LFLEVDGDVMSVSTYDYIFVALIFIITLAGIADLFRKRQRYNSYREAKTLVIVGILFLVVSTVGNCLIEGNWNIEYIISFLSLRKVSYWFFLELNSLGYMSLSWGFVILLIVFKKRRNVYKE